MGRREDDWGHGNGAVQIIILRYAPDSPEIRASLDAHRAFLNRYVGNGEFVCCGPLPGRAGEVIIARRKMREDAGKVMEKEPYVAGGCATFEIFSFNPSAYADGFEKFL